MKRKYSPCKSYLLTHHRSAIIEEQANIQLVEPNQVKITEKQTLIEDTPDSLLNAILEKDKELNRLLHEKEMLLSRLINLPQEQMKDTPGNVRILNLNRSVEFRFPQIAVTQTTKANSSIEAITNAASCRKKPLRTIFPVKLSNGSFR